MQKQEYKTYAEKKSPNSPLWLNMLKAFLIGGLICVLGEGVRSFYTNWGLSLEEVAAATSITMVFLGVLLTGIGIYDNIAKHAGAARSFPLPVLPTPSPRQRLNIKAKDTCWASAQKCLSLQVPLSSMERWLPSLQD